MRHLPLVIVAGSAISCAAGAQQPDSVRDTARVAPVVVTATRVPFARDRVPASVTVLDGASLRAQGVLHLGDALRHAPGIAVVQGGSYGAQTSLFTRGGQANYTKVLVDGVPINDPGGSLDIGTLTIDDVDRIEIVRGPTSVVHGSDAVTGVVQIFTRRGGPDWRGAFDARGGTYGSYDLAADARGPVGRGARVSVSGAHHATDGIYRFNSRYRNDVFTTALTLEPWSGVSVSATGRYVDANAHFPTDFTGAPVDPNSFRTEKRTLLGATVRQALGAATVRLALTSNLGDLASENPPNDAADFASTLRTHVARQAADVSVVAPIASVVRATIGGTLERQHQTSPDTGRRNTAAYVELVGDARGTSAAAGARVDHSSVYGDFGTYRVSVSRVLPAAIRLRAGLGTAFREPSFVESFDTPFSTANPSLRPERTTSWEVGIERPFGADRVTVGGTYFQQRFVDLIDYRFAASGSTYENIARARADGGEIEVRTAPERRISADASYTFLSTRVLRRGFSTSSLATLVEGGPLLRRPRHSASAGIGVRAARGASLDVRATYVGAREDRRFHGAPNFETEAVTLAPYTKVDLAGAVPLSLVVHPLDAVTATFRIENALAARYESVAGYATPGRSILAGLRAAF